MSLDASRLNGTRFASCLADIQTQFPIPAGLLPAEAAACPAYYQKLAHALADHEGTDVVSEITGHAEVPAGIPGQVLTGVGVGGQTITQAPGTVV